MINALVEELRVDEEIAEVVRSEGWYALGIPDHEPPFLYTIGLMLTLRHPEFIVFGLEDRDARALCSQLVADIRGGRSYAEPGVYSINIGTAVHRVGFRRVHPTQHELYLGFALGFARRMDRWGDIEVMQVFWPDSQGKFPFDAGCAWEVFELQPRLDLGLSARELKQWRRQWGLD